MSLLQYAHYRQGNQQLQPNLLDYQLYILLARVPDVSNMT